MSRRILTVAALLTGFTLQAADAQSKPSFAGTWKINTEKSDPMGGGMGGGGGGGGMGGAMMAPLTITQTEAELVETRTVGEQTRTVTYKLDGTESVNPGMRGGASRSKARWEGTSLFIETTSTFSGPSGEMTITSREVRTLSADGKIMTAAVTRNTPNGEVTTRRVYDKQ